MMRMTLAPHTTRPALAARLVCLAALLLTVSATGALTGCGFDFGFGGRSGGKVTLAATVFKDRRMPGAPNTPGGETVTLEYNCDCFKSALGGKAQATSVLSYEFSQIMKVVPNGGTIPAEMGEMAAWAGSENYTEFEKSIVRYKCNKDGAKFEKCAE